MACEEKYLNMMNQWLILKQEGKGFDKYLKRQGYNTVAVYGMGIYGRHVIRELQGTEIRISYGIDRKKIMPYKNVEVLQPTERMSPVDAIINTVLCEHVNIKSYLAQICESPVLSLEDIVFGSYE